MRSGRFASPRLSLHLDLNTPSAYFPVCESDSFQMKDAPDMRPRNVLVILCDQLRPDFMPVYGCNSENS